MPNAPSPFRRKTPTPDFRAPKFPASNDGKPNRAPASRPTVDWKETFPLCTRKELTLEKPFHTVLHVAESLTRHGEFGEHTREWTGPGEMRMSLDLLPSLETAFFKARMPSHVTLRESSSGAGGQGRVCVTFGSPYRLVMDGLLCLALLGAATGAFSAGSPGAGVLLVFCLAVGLVPSLFLEARTRRAFRTALARASGGALVTTKRAS